MKTHETVHIAHRTGAAVPLGALRTADSSVIGEFMALPVFAQFCKGAGLSVIQLLPVLDTGTHSSPYSSLSAFALHPVYITISRLPNFRACYEKDSAFKKEYDSFLRMKDAPRFDYDAVCRTKDAMLRKLFRAVKNVGGTGVESMGAESIKFKDTTAWLPEYCVFKHLKQQNAQAGWKHWKAADKNLPQEEIIERWNDPELAEEIKKIFEGDLIAHFGGDRFVVMTERENIKEDMEKLRVFGHSTDRDVRVEIKSGIAFIQKDDNEIAAVCDRAMLACESIKNQYDIISVNKDTLFSRPRPRFREQILANNRLMQSTVFGIISQKVCLIEKVISIFCFSFSSLVSGVSFTRFLNKVINVKDIPLFFKS